MTCEYINKSDINSAAQAYNLSCCSYHGSGVCSGSIGITLIIYDDNHMYSIDFHNAI
jgi:hypothetical protein